MSQNHGLWEEYILNTGSKIAFFRKFKKISLKTLSAKTKIPLKTLEMMENSSLELITPEISKLAAYFKVEPELLLSASSVIEIDKLRKLDFIFRQFNQTQDTKALQSQVTNWIILSITDERQHWQKSRKESVEVLCKINRSQEAQKRAQSRDKKFAPFREYFKKIQRQRFNKYMKLGKKLTANGFVLWFLKTKAAKISIPYRQSNWESKLNQLAQANNREFKKAFE